MGPPMPPGPALGPAEPVPRFSNWGPVRCSRLPNPLLALLSCDALLVYYLRYHLLCYTSFNKGDTNRSTSRFLKNIEGGDKEWNV